MARRLVIGFGILAAIAGIITDDGELFVVGTMAAGGAWLCLDGNGGRKF